jgi:hypothetical protein
MASQGDQAQVDEPQHHEQQHRNHADVWSTRIQRELLTLVTDNGDAETTAQERSMLPPFCKVLEHKLDIEGGKCQLDFAVEISVPVMTTGADPQDTSYATPTTKTVVKTVVVTLDASMNAADNKTQAYPFLEPTAVLKDGQDVFPPGSTIQVGDKMDMDLDWTPSLHLTDAILNLALKIKESVLQGEPFHAAAPSEIEQKQQQQHQLQQNIHAEIDEVAKGARRFASSLSKGAKGITKVFSPRTTKPVAAAAKPKAPSTTPSKTSKAQPTTKDVIKSPSVTGSPKTPVSSLSAARVAAAAGQVQIGDEINLLEKPWVEAHGVYSCKAIRRPGFIQDTMARAAAAKEKEEQQFRSPTAMFRSFTQSAKSVLEESFLMITETHIVELKASKLNLSCGTVTIVIPINLMAKLKFRRQESVSLFFKPAPDDPLIYMCPDAGDAVHQIQTVLKRYGVKGKHTNAAAHRAINDALELVQEIQTKELALKHDPTVERVNEIMDLYRQSAERFEVAGDIRHEEVVTHMRKFLALPLTTGILDGSHVKPAQAVKKPSSGGNGVVPEGEVLERSTDGLEDDDYDDDMEDAGPVLEGKKEKENDKEFDQKMDNVLKEAQEDLQKYKMDGDETLETDTASGDTADTDIADMAADLDAMMKEADKELADLMSS